MLVEAPAGDNLLVIDGPQCATITWWKVPLPGGVEMLLKLSWRAMAIVAAAGEPISWPASPPLNPAAWWITPWQRWTSPFPIPW